MLGAYVEGKHRIDARLVRRAAAEILGRPQINLIAYYAGATTVVLIIAALMVWALRNDNHASSNYPAVPRPASDLLPSPRAASLHASCQRRHRAPPKATNPRANPQHPPGDYRRHHAQ